MRHVLGFFAIFALSQDATAQFSNPWGSYGFPNPGFQNTVQMGSYTGRLMGYMPNGTRIVNPWAPQQIQPIIPAAIHNHQAQYSYATLFNPSLYSYQPLWNTSPYSFNNPQPAILPGVIPGINGGADFPGVDTATQVSTPRVQLEVGRFVPLNRDLSVNPFSGTVLSARRGIALTREGTFYRLPGTGSMTAWGTFIPGSGVYVNPLTGTAYNPVTGVIAR